MPVFVLLLVLLIGVPLLEIYVLIEVGRVIGAGTTVFLVVLTAVLGAALLRIQGLNTLSSVRGALARGELPALPLIEGMILLFTAALLLTPGFVTDALGFIVLLAPVRRRLARLIAGRVFAHRSPPAAGGGSHTIEGRYRVEDD